MMGASAAFMTPTGYQTNLMVYVLLARPISHCLAGNLSLDTHMGQFLKVRTWRVPFLRFSQVWGTLASVAGLCDDRRPPDPRVLVRSRWSDVLGDETSKPLTLCACRWLWTLLFAGVLCGCVILHLRTCLAERRRASRLAESNANGGNVFSPARVPTSMSDFHGDLRDLNMRSGQRCVVVLLMFRSLVTLQSQPGSPHPAPPPFADTHLCLTWGSFRLTTTTRTWTAPPTAPTTP